MYVRLYVCTVLIYIYAFMKIFLCYTIYMYFLCNGLWWFWPRKKVFFFPSPRTDSLAALGVCVVEMDYPIKRKAIARQSYQYNDCDIPTRGWFIPNKYNPTSTYKFTKLTEGTGVEGSKLFNRDWRFAAQFNDKIPIEQLYGVRSQRLLLSTVELQYMCSSLDGCLVSKNKKLNTI